MTALLTELLKKSSGELVKQHSQIARYREMETLTDEQKERYEYARSKFREAAKIRVEMLERLSGRPAPEPLESGGRLISVFFSHSFKEDHKLRLRRFVETACSNLAIDYVIGEGPTAESTTSNNFEEKILAAIAKSDLYFAIMTPDKLMGSEPSGWTLFELGIARALNKPIAIMAQEELRTACLRVTPGIQIGFFKADVITADCDSTDAGRFRMSIQSKLIEAESIFIARIARDSNSQVRS